jgi:hypothetical protein
MSRLKSLLQEAGAIKTRIADYDTRIKGLQSQLEELQSNPIKVSAVDTTDEASVLKLSSRKLRIEVLPQQIAELDSEKGDAVRELGATAELLRRHLEELNAAEQRKVVEEIASVLEPYSTTARVNGNDIDPARNAAWTMPIIFNMANAVAWNAGVQPPNEASIRRHERPEVFDRDTFEFAAEKIGAGERYLTNGQSFIPEFFRKKKR